MVLLSEENKRQLYIPVGFAHGFLVKSKEAIFTYKCSDFYNPEHESGIIWNDKNINIDWPIDNVDNLIISEKDKNLKTLYEVDIPFKYEG
ncbi:dTDP-4-dehydrorhamnose 3%2C5-epimerase [uncultured Clostridium sp.]|nr:dTDP-4-dehydrorhamnose 3%2C5-epimerase [uncultured Clostridium sp.]